MKITTYKCDICGQICSSIEELVINDLGYRSNVKITINAEERWGHPIDICKKCLLAALNKAFEEDR